MRATDQYLQALLLYYEEEVMGEADFYGLADHFDEWENWSYLPGWSNGWLSQSLRC